MTSQNEPRTNKLKSEGRLIGRQQPSVSTSPQIQQKRRTSADKHVGAYHHSKNENKASASEATALNQNKVKQSKKVSFYNF